MNKNKFRIWNKKYQQYTTPEFTGELNNVLQDDGYIFQQFTGILDEKMVEIYEGDVIHYSTTPNKDIGEVYYSPDFCGYIVDGVPLKDLPIEQLYVLGNICENYMYNEKGDLTVKLLRK